MKLDGTPGGGAFRCGGSAAANTAGDLTTGGAMTTGGGARGATPVRANGRAEATAGNMAKKLEGMTRVSATRKDKLDGTLSQMTTRETWQSDPEPSIERSTSQATIESTISRILFEILSLGHCISSENNHIEINFQ